MKLVQITHPRQLEALKPSPVRWSDSNPDGWRAVYEKFGSWLVPMVVNRQTRSILSPPGIYEQNAMPRQSDELNCPIPVLLVDLPPHLEKAACIVLAGGIDRLLLPRVADEDSVGVLLDLIDEDFSGALALGVGLDELGGILDSVASAGAGAADEDSLPALPGLHERGAWGIPMLDPALQVDAVSSGCKWGSVRRGSDLSGFLAHFYCTDSKFSALVRDISPLLASRPEGMGELNFSTSPAMPAALVMYRTYQKRTVSAAAQAAGLRVAVDLNVSPEWFDINLLGVPAGWRAYINRARSSELDHLEAAYLLACERRGGDDVLYIVYGGGQRVRELCERRGWSWLPEESDVVRGRYGTD